jgi:hypothetical protein
MSYGRYMSATLLSYLPVGRYSITKTTRSIQQKQRGLTTYNIGKPTGNVSKAKNNV